MKNLSIMLFLSLALFGCATKDTKNTAETASEKPQNLEGKNLPKPSEQKVSPNGERIVSPVEVKFDQKTMPAGWEKIGSEAANSEDFDAGEGVLKLKIPSGTDLYGAKQNAPRLLKAISGDFEIETKLKFDPKNSYQGAGILVWNDDKNYLRFERGFGGVDGGESGVRLDKSVDGVYSSISGTENSPTETPEIELKLIRKGQEFTAFMRENIDGEWKEVGIFTSNYPETVKVGIVGVSTADEIIAEFKYIRIMPIGK